MKKLFFVWLLVQTLLISATVGSDLKEKIDDWVIKFSKVGFKQRKDLKIELEKLPNEDALKFVWLLGQDQPFEEVSIYIKAILGLETEGLTEILKKGIPTCTLILNLIENGQKNELDTKLFQEYLQAGQMAIKQLAEDSSLWKKIIEDFEEFEKEAKPGLQDALNIGQELSTRLNRFDIENFNLCLSEQRLRRQENILLQAEKDQENLKKVYSRIDSCLLTLKKKGALQKIQKLVQIDRDYSDSITNGTDKKTQEKLYQTLNEELDKIEKEHKVLTEKIDEQTLKFTEINIDQRDALKSELEKLPNEDALSFIWLLTQDQPFEMISGCIQSISMLEENVSKKILEEGIHYFSLMRDLLKKSPDDDLVLEKSPDDNLTRANYLPESRQLVFNSRRLAIDLIESRIKLSRSFLEASQFAVKLLPINPSHWQGLITHYKEYEKPLIRKQKAKLLN